MHRNGGLWHIQPGFHGLSETRHQVEEFGHGERNQAICECLPYWVYFLWDVLHDCYWCVVLAHSLDVCLIGLYHPLLGWLAYFVLLLPFHSFRLATGCDLLDLNGDCVYRGSLPFFL